MKILHNAVFHVALLTLALSIMSPVTGKITDLFQRVSHRLDQVQVTEH